MVRERRVLILAVTALFGLAALVWSVRQERVYEAESTLNFKGINVDSSVLGTVTFDSAGSPDQRAAVAAERLGDLDVVDRARRILKTGESPETLRAAVSAAPETRTALVVVRARRSRPALAARTADAFATAVRDLETKTARDRYEEAAASQRQITRALPDDPENAFARSISAQQAARLEQLARLVNPVEITRRATVPEASIAPRPIRNTALGLVLGLTLALVAAFARDSLDRRFKTSQDIAEELEMPLLAFVPEDAMGRTIVANGKRPIDAADLEGFRILRTNVEFLDIDKTPKLVLVTSALPEEGKSTVSASLACTYATAGKRTLLLECDLRRPTLAERLQLSERPGLTDYLLGSAAPQEILQTLSITAPPVEGEELVAPPQPVAPLVVITAGSPTPQPAEALRSERFKRFLEQVCEVYDTIIVDTSPLLSVADALGLLQSADAILLCVRASQTTREQARAARSALDKVPESPRGVVVTGVRESEVTDYGYYSYGAVYGSERR